MSESQLQNLWNLINDLGNYKRLRHHARNLTSDRNKILKSLEETANQIEQYTKYGYISRIIFSATEIVGNLGGFYMESSRFDYSLHAFFISTACGFLNVISSVTELFFFENTVYDVIKIVRRYRNLLIEIQSWAGETEELRRAFQNICPVDSVLLGIPVFECNLSTVDFLLFCFRSQENIKQMTSSTFEDLLNWLIFSSNPLVYDVGRAWLQSLYSPKMFLISQYVPALSEKDRHLLSVPVSGRMAFNYGTILRAIMNLRKSEMSFLAYEIRRFKDELKDQMDSLERIINYCDLKQII